MANNARNVSSLNLDQLIALRDEVAAAIATMVANERRELEMRLSKLTALGSVRRTKPAAPSNEARAPRRLAARGPRKGSRVAPKYRGPGGETWAGRGLTPKWLTRLEQNGKKRDSFLIKH